ncbi:MAG: hypothetical protein ACRC3B_22390, partial [Bacteroidia bacterium]
MNKQLKIITGILVAVTVIGVIISVKSLTGDTAKDNNGCLRTGRYTLKQVFLDSMLFVNGAETQRLARFDITEQFIRDKPVTLVFQGEIGRSIYEGKGTISFKDSDYGIAYKVESSGRVLSECHEYFRLVGGITTSNGIIISDTVQNENQIRI